MEQPDVILLAPFDGKARDLRLLGLRYVVQSYSRLLPVEQVTERIAVCRELEVGIHSTCVHEPRGSLVLDDRVIDL